MKVLLALGLCLSIVLTGIQSGARFRRVVPNRLFAWVPFLEAARDGRVQEVRNLIKNGTDVNTRSDNGDTGLYTATWYGHKDVVQLLLRHGANVNVQNNAKQTPLLVATIRGNKELMELLIRYGADATIEDRLQQRPIDYANQRGDQTIIDLLIKAPGPAEVACQYFSKLSVVPRVLNGEFAEPEEFPWMAALGYVDMSDNSVSFDCGGTIISELFIMTAAHCARPARKPVLVRLGKLNLTDNGDNDDQSGHYQIEEIIRHPHYTLLTRRNDIALIRLVKRISFNRDVVPACLRTDLLDLDSSVRMFVSGWGTTSADRPELSNELRKTQLKTLSLDECNATLAEYNIRAQQAPLRNGIMVGQYCAYDPLGKNDSCAGDSGGPLQFFPENEPLASVIGIVSYGISCGSELPGLYTRVAKYVDWIEPIVWPKGLADKTMITPSP